MIIDIYISADDCVTINADGTKYANTAGFVGGFAVSLSVNVSEYIYTGTVTGVPALIVSSN